MPTNANTNGGGSSGNCNHGHYRPTPCCHLSPVTCHPLTSTQPLTPTVVAWPRYNTMLTMSSHVAHCPRLLSIPSEAPVVAATAAAFPITLSTSLPPSAHSFFLLSFF